MNEKIRLLEAWNKDIFGELSISEIMRNTRKKSKPWVFNTLKSLTTQKLLLSKRKANLNIYSLNLDNPFLTQTLQYLESQKNWNFPKLEIITEAINNTPVKNYCLLVFGSYAENRQKANSDLDLCFLIENKQTEKEIKPHLNEIKLNHLIQIDDHYITCSEFIKMLLRKEENLGKQIFRKHKIFYNADIYYQLIKEAHKRGFRP